MDFEKTTTATQLNFRKLHWNADFCWIFFYWNNDYLRKELIEVEPRGPLVYLSFEDGSLCLSTIPKSNRSMVTQQWATCFKWCNRSHFASNFLNLSFPKVLKIINSLYLTCPFNQTRTSCVVIAACFHISQVGRHRSPHGRKSSCRDQGKGVGATSSDHLLTTSDPCE